MENTITKRRITKIKVIENWDCNYEIRVIKIKIIRKRIIRIKVIENNFIHKFIEITIIKIEIIENRISWSVKFWYF